MTPFWLATVCHFTLFSDDCKIRGFAQKFPVTGYSRTLCTTISMLFDVFNGGGNRLMHIVFHLFAFLDAQVINHVDVMPAGN
jgi:hypothetical protein